MQLVRVLFVTMALLAPAVASTAVAQPPQEQTGEFLPVGEDEIPEQMPAAPLLIGAYAFVFAALFVYVVSLSKRLSAVKADMARLEADIKRGTRG